MSECKVNIDFLRHIANPALALAMVNISNGRAELQAKNQEESKQVLQKITSALLDIKKGLSNGEIKYNFSIYGGDPRNIAKYLTSPEWRGLVELTFGELKDTPGAWEFVRGVLMELLTKAANTYGSQCPEVSEACKNAIEDLSKMKPSLPKNPEGTELSKA
ncbi:hypothetical protein ASAC_1084 [Acidilobus saccharovorans 345-15]|uniref:Uncharacterized protein n=1 Tax=Acidilobus saccharovorans (strain DSM 16705 / JCM 18335 / VKM B-2471 / 345-15) TaxID=666510 RepID=D9Q2F1_ACIS3|nr:hypothetical protein [Acidilobus saccharovorans]ADL19489.1 hypothetical protein ASAC_1084 [Acidilobus saccharovorans 345-15]